MPRTRWTLTPLVFALAVVALVAARPAVKGPERVRS